MNQVFLQPSRSFWSSHKTQQAVVLSLFFHFLLFILWAFYGSDKLPLNEETSLTPAKVHVVQKEDLNKRVLDLLQPDNAKKPEKSDYLSEKNFSTLKQTKQALSKRSGQKAKKKTQKTTPRKSYDLSLSPQFIFKDIMQAEQNNNYLPDISLGDETLINTQEFKYASFFIRMKRQLEGYWQPRPLVQKYNLNALIYKSNIRIVLDAKGNVLLAELVKSSGEQSLDQEALRSVKNAGPYFNPPTQMLNEKRHLVIPSWSFIITKK